MAEELILLRKARKPAAPSWTWRSNPRSREKGRPGRLPQRLKAAGAALLISFHDFAKTQQLIETSARIEAFRPDM